jgi:N-methylhydantoinase A/oxoprolinase/acetone carboxylase beta subunit
MTRVLVPRASGVLSALGLAAADQRVDVQRSVLGQPYDLDALAAEARERLRRADAAIEVAYDCRYRGQSFELTVADPAAFEAAHEDRYGFREEQGVVDVVTVRVTARVAGPAVELAAPPGRPAERSTRATAWGPGPRSCAATCPRAPRSRARRSCTCRSRRSRSPPGWTGTVDATGTLELTWTR